MLLRRLSRLSVALRSFVPRFADALPRVAVSAVSQSLASKPMVAVESLEPFDLGRAMSPPIYCANGCLSMRLARRKSHLGPQHQFVASSSHTPSSKRPATPPGAGRFSPPPAPPGTASRVRAISSAPTSKASARTPPPNCSCTSWTRTASWTTSTAPGTSRRRTARNTPPSSPAKTQPPSNSASPPARAWRGARAEQPAFACPARRRWLGNAALVGQPGAQ